jgi:hypothetical protein
VAESADAPLSKSGEGDLVWVRPPPSAPGKTKRPYEPPRVLTDEAFEQLSLACTTKLGPKKNFT